VDPPKKWKEKGDRGCKEPSSGEKTKKGREKRERTERRGKKTGRTSQTGPRKVGRGVTFLRHLNRPAKGGGKSRASGAGGQRRGQTTAVQISRDFSAHSPRRRWTLRGTGNPEGGGTYLRQQAHLPLDPLSKRYRAPKGWVRPTRSWDEPGL